MGDHFIQIQCPSCASTEVEPVGANTYRCRHCNSTFIYRDPRPPPPQAPPPPQPTQSPWGPQPQQQSPQVYVVAHTGASAGRWIAWVIVMLVVFGGSGISAFIAWFNGVQTTTTTTSSTPTATATPPTPKVAAPPSPSKPYVPTPPAILAPDTKADAKEESDTAAEPEPPPPVDLQSYQALTGCGCRTDVDRDGRKDQIDLYLRAGTSAVISSAGTQNFVETTWAVAGEGLKPFDLPVTEETAPAKRYAAGRFGVGVGCENDIFVVAARETISAWSLSKRELKWTRPLGAEFSRFAEGKASVDCSAISVSAGIMNVRTEGGTKSLRLDNGEDASRSPTRPSTGTSSSTTPKPTPKPEPKADSKPDPKPTPAPTKPETKPKKPTPTPTPTPTGDKKKGKKTAKRAQ